MKWPTIRVTVNSDHNSECGEFDLHNLTLDEAAHLIADNAPHYTSIVLVVVRQ